MIRRACRAACCGLLLTLAACKVGPEFTPPDPGVPERFRNAADAPVSGAADPAPRWWEAFNDPVLNELIQRATAGNLTVQQAVMRVVGSRQQENASRAAGVPRIGAAAGYAATRLPLEGLLKSSGAYGALSDAARRAGRADALNKLEEPVSSLFGALYSTWQLDLFGRVSRQVEAAEANTAAAKEAVNDALVTLQADVAQAYFTLRAAQAQAQAQRAAVAATREQLALNASLRRAGLSPEFDVQVALRGLQLNEQSLPDYGKQELQARNTLAVLCGQPPGALDALLAASPPPRPVPALVGTGVPSGLARRRPDIRQAEAQLRAAVAQEGLAEANFYPEITLLGGVGSASSDLRYLTSWSSLFYVLSPAVSVPVFQGGRLTAQLKLARAESITAALAYRAAVLGALQEVENALVAYQSDRQRRERTEATLRSARESLALNRDSYRAGLVPFLQVLLSENAEISARQALIQADLTLSLDIVTLYQALGGGWQQGRIDMADPPALAPIPPTPAALDAAAARLLRPRPEVTPPGCGPATPC